MIDNSFELNDIVIIKGIITGAHAITRTTKTGEKKKVLYYDIDDIYNGKYHLYKVPEEVLILAKNNGARD